MAAGAAITKDYGRRDSDIDLTISNQVSDLRHDVAKADADTSRAFLQDNHVQSMLISSEACAINKNVSDAEARTSNHLAAMERDIQNRIFESQKEALEAKCALLEKVGSEALRTNEKVDRESDVIRKEMLDFRFDVRNKFDDTHRQIGEFKSETLKEFCATRAAIDECCCEMKLLSVNTENSRLRDELNRSQADGQSTSIINAVVAAVSKKI